MSPKRQIAKEIHLLEEEMKILEGKRNRSQAHIIESLMAKTEPDPQEKQFFRTFSAEIEVKRERLTELTEKLKNLL